MIDLNRATQWLNPAASPLALGVLLALTAAVGGVLLAFGGPLIAAALLVGGVAGYLVLRDIRLGFAGVVGVVFLLPFATLPVDIGVTPTFLDVALGAVVGVWLLRIVTGRKRAIVTSPVTLPLVLFMGVAVFAFIFGLQNGPLTPTLLRRFAELLLSIGFLLVVVDYCHRWDRLAFVVRAVLLAGGAASLIAIGLWLIPETVANQLLNYLTRLGYPGGWVIRYIEENPALAERAIGTSVDPNALGGLLLMIGALAGPQLVAKKTILPRWLAWVVTGLLFVAILLTFSRAAAGGLAIGLFFVAVVRYRRLLPFLAGAGALIVILPATQGYVARLLAGVRGEDLATRMRIGEYTDALTLIGRYPLFGVGFAGSPDIDLYLGVASLYLTIGQQMGLLGLLSFLALIAVIFGYAFQKRAHFRSGHALDNVWLGLHAALVGGLAAGVLDHYFISLDFHHTVTLFWLMLGLAVASTYVGSRMLPAEK